VDNQARWLEVSLTVDGELAEAVADVLARYTTNGVVIESDVKFNDEEDEGTAYGPVRVFGYLAIDDQLETRRQQVEEGLWYLGRIQPLPPLSFKTIDDQDWMAAWKQHYHPIPIGKKLLVLPAWLEDTYPERVVIKIDPSMAFGTGTHPTTQLCLELLETYTPAGQPVIDVGCGSGILSIAARKLGASHALAVDIDSQAARSTAENAETNAIDGIEMGVGSVTEVKAGQFSLTAAPLVLANILAPIIIRLLDDGLADLVAPGGVIIFSGVLDRQADDVLAAAARRGLKELERRQINDWVAMACRKA